MKYAYVNYYHTVINDEGQKFLYCAMPEFVGCCGIHVLTPILFSVVPKKQQEINEALKIIVETLKPSFRLLYLTHNDTLEGKKVIHAAKNCGFTEDHVIGSNHAWDGNNMIHVMSIRGDKPPPIKNGVEYQFAKVFS